MRYWQAKLYNIWQQTRTSLLYVPALFCLAFGMLGLGLLQLDLHFADDLSDQRLIYNGDLDDAQDSLGLLLSCMITMATLVISITMVVLSLSASQLGPRLVRIFMGDRRTKAYFGVFFGSITFCFTCLGILHDPVSSQVVPRVTISVVFLVCFLNLLVLLAYVNHVAHSGIADNIIARLTRELLESIDRLAVGRGSEQAQVNRSGEGYIADPHTHRKDFFRSATSGYIQSIQFDSLYHCAQKTDAYIHVTHKPGDHIVKGQDLAVIYSPSGSCNFETIEGAVKDAIIVGEYRTATQDIEYSLRHMVEIALRALSPGINDSFTAATVLDKLTGVLAHLFTVSLPVYAFKNDEGLLRVTGVSTSEADLIFKGLSQIRDAGQNQFIVLKSLIINIGALIQLANRDTERGALALQVKYIKLHINDHFSGSPSEEILQRWFTEHQLDRL